MVISNAFSKSQVKPQTKEDEKKKNEIQPITIKCLQDQIFMTDSHHYDTTAANDKERLNQDINTIYGQNPMFHF